MRTEREKMLSGELYDPLDPQLSAERRRARLLVKRLNDTRDDLRQADRDRRMMSGLAQARSFAPAFGISEGAVIGAGSVVTRDIPERVVAAGNPCRVIRRLEE